MIFFSVSGCIDSGSERNSTCDIKVLQEENDRLQKELSELRSLLGKEDVEPKIQTLETELEHAKEALAGK